MGTNRGFPRRSPSEDPPPDEERSAPEVSPPEHPAAPAWTVDHIASVYEEENASMATTIPDVTQPQAPESMNGAFDPTTVSLPHKLIEPEPPTPENVFIQRSETELRLKEISEAGNTVLRLISEAMSIQLSAAEMKNKMLQSTLLARQQGNEPASQSQLLAWLFQSDGQEQVSAAAHQGTKIIIGLANEIAKAAHVDLDRVPFTTDGADKQNSAIVQLRDILLARLNDGRGTPTPAARPGTSYSA